ncbi:MAG: ion transporter [Bacteroidales bacterium]|jgi:voltage-gated potassium channel|nr:ion transporter [Bacteroidales bacterium]
MRKIKNLLYQIIFETDTRPGKWFDIILLWAILLSVLTVVIESVKPVRASFGDYLLLAEWFFTILFSVEYVTRIWVSRKPLNYIFSSLGIIDFLSIIPTYFSLLFVGTHYLMAIRVLRLLRVFRIFKLNYYLNQGELIILALKASVKKISVFLFAILNIVVVIGALMYVVEGENSGFDSIPRSIYWAIVTITTVGYGDISPQTPFGQFVSSVIMILGYSIIAVPTGIFSAEFVRQSKSPKVFKCPKCSHKVDHMHDNFCSYCGTQLKK